MRGSRTDALGPEEMASNGRARIGTDRPNAVYVLIFVLCTAIHLRLPRSSACTRARASAMPPQLVHGFWAKPELDLACRTRRPRASLVVVGLGLTERVAAFPRPGWRRLALLDCCWLLRGGSGRRRCRCRRQLFLNDGDREWR